MNKFANEGTPRWLAEDLTWSGLFGPPASQPKHPSQSVVTQHDVLSCCRETRAGEVDNQLACPCNIACENGTEYVRACVRACVRAFAACSGRSHTSFRSSCAARLACLALPCMSRKITQLFMMAILHALHARLVKKILPGALNAPNERPQTEHTAHSISAFAGMAYIPVVACLHPIKNFCGEKKQ